MKRTRQLIVALASVVWAEAQYIFGQMVVLTLFLILPISAVYLFAMYSRHVPFVVWLIVATIAYGLLLWRAVVQARHVLYISRDLAEHEQYFWDDDFIEWQYRRYSRVFDPERQSWRPHEMTFNRRIRLADRLYCHTLVVSHTRWWERLLRWLPRGLVLYAAKHACTSDLIPPVMWLYCARQAPAWDSNAAVRLFNQKLVEILEA